MPQFPLAEYGIALGSIIALVFIVKQFLSHLKEKDEKFTNVISNHLTHATEAQAKLGSAIDKNTEATSKLVDRVDRL